MPDVFPAVGHKYLVEFRAPGAQFRVQLDFTSATSLTYTGVKPDGSLDTGNVETVTINVEPIRDQLFLVTWKEELGTTVVHLEDYKNNTIITNITEPDGTFSTFHGVMTVVSQLPHDYHEMLALVRQWGGDPLAELGGKSTAESTRCRSFISSAGRTSQCPTSAPTSIRKTSA
jgi:hypothetical protein